MTGAENADTQLTDVQRDRVAGVLLGQACGDALGVPYEFGTLPDGAAEMIGGGLGPYTPAEWSDDTQMAACIARVSATGADLTSPDALDLIAAAFLAWQRGGATDIGAQTRLVLGRVERPDVTEGLGQRLADAAAALHATGARTAGNGALMRGGIIGLTRLDDRMATAAAATAVAELTHTDPLAAESCVLHAEAIRVAVLTGELELSSGLDLLAPDRRDFWETALAEADHRHGSTRTPDYFANNGFAVTALQAAWAAITSTEDNHDRPGDQDQLVGGLQAAVHAGNDTDTVAAIAGALLGARHGAVSVPAGWTDEVHGWPGTNGAGLVDLALRTADAGR